MTEERSQSCDIMKRLAAGNSLPWLIGGDFNELLGIHEKEGGLIRPINQILEFRRVVYDCQLHDLGFTGNPFTWVTTRSGGVKERLDTVLATNGLKEMFNNARVTHLDPLKSDHVPILIGLDGTPNLRRSNRRAFRFEKFWVDHEDCESIIQEA